MHVGFQCSVSHCCRCRAFSYTHESTLSIRLPQMKSKKSMAENFHPAVIACCKLHVRYQAAVQGSVTSIFHLNLGATDTMAAAASSGALSEKEAEVYDRQIRLWGVEAQKRMRSSRVLVIGLGALGAEVAKNLVLAGINLTLHDNRVVDETALGTQFFLSADDIGRTRAAACLPRVQEMNPLVEVHVLDREVAALGDEELCAFRLAIHCGNSTAAEQVRHPPLSCRELHPAIRAA